jgi:hypothetical protein
MPLFSGQQALSRLQLKKVRDPTNQHVKIISGSFEPILALHGFVGCL